MKKIKKQKPTGRLGYLVIMLISVLILVSIFVGYSKITGLPTLTTQDTTICVANTYYIDYATGNDTNNGTCSTSAWKRVPGMTGFAGTYTHHAGDSFVFKGGVTWPASVLPLTIIYSGNATNIDTYTVDKNWYSGTAWSYPVFDEQQNGEHIIFMNYGGQSYVKIDNLKLINVNDGVNSVSGTAIDLYDGSNIEISNCWLEPTSVEALGFVAYQKNVSHINFHNNFIRKALRSSIYGYNPYVVDDFQFHDNDWQGAGDLELHGYHGDGLMIGAPIAMTAPVVTNFRFYNNYFYGDWRVGTALFYSNGWTNGTKLYNNVFSFENTAPIQNIFSPGFVDYGYSDANIEVYNNIFANDNMHGYLGGDGLGAKFGVTVNTPVSGTTVVIKNNIFSLTELDIGVDTGATLIADYNLHNPDQNTSSWRDLIYYGSAQYKTLAEVQEAGFELHSPAVGDPKFVSIGNGTTGSANWQLQSSSPAIGAGVQLNSLFTTDILGVNRGSAWDIGAYEYTNGTLTPINGQCGISNNVCATGTLNDIVDNSTTYLWQCLGQNGGTNANCNLIIPVTPPVDTGGSEGSSGGGNEGSAATSSDINNSNVSSGTSGENTQSGQINNSTESSGNSNNLNLTKSSQLLSSLRNYLILFALIIIIAIALVWMIMARKAKAIRTMNEMLSQNISNFNNATNQE